LRPRSSYNQEEKWQLRYYLTGTKNTTSAKGISRPDSNKIKETGNTVNTKFLVHYQMPKLQFTY